MVKNVDYGSRRKAILTATINKYIQEALPIASEDIASDFDLSSATIRNIFADLEETGYLTHPYTSGGRVPTAKGYRYFVDFLMLELPDYSSDKEMHKEEREFVTREYQREVVRMEDALERTSEIVSALTHYTSVVSILDWQDKFFYKGVGFVLEEPEFQDFNRIRFLVRMMEDKQRLLAIINRQFHEKVKIYIGDELGCQEIDNCALAVSAYRVKNSFSGRLAVLGPMRMKYSHIVSTLEYISDALGTALEETLE